MDLSKIMAISGKSGLFKIVSQSRGSIIVESLGDGKKMPVFATHRSSVLEDISMFTQTEDVPLKEVLWKIYQTEGGKELSLDMKADSTQLKEYFETILPEYDQERVYASDIRKVFAWYNLLLEHDLISEPVKEEESEEDTTDAEEKKEQKEKKDEVKEEKEEAKKATAKKPADKKASSEKKSSGDK